MDMWFPNMNCGIATCLNRAIDMAGLSPAGLQPCRPLPRSGRAVFPHPVPRFRLFLPSRQPIRRHPDLRITLQPCKSSNIMDYSGARQGESLENLSKFLMIYKSIPVAFTKPAPPRLFCVFGNHLQHLVVSPHPKILIKPPKLAA
jgi:hypothetical protein